MDIVKRLPDDVRRRIVLYLSTPTADLIKRDLAVQMRHYSREANGDVEEWRNLFGRIRFAEVKWFQIVRMFKRVGDLTITWGSRQRFIRDVLRVQHVDVVMIENNNDDDDDDVSDDMSESDSN